MYIATGGELMTELLTVSVKLNKQINYVLWSFTSAENIMDKKLQCYTFWEYVGVLLVRKSLIYL